MLQYFKSNDHCCSPSLLITVYTWPWAALVSVLSINSNKHYSLRHPGTALCPSGSLFTHKLPTSPASRLLEVQMLYRLEPGDFKCRYDVKHVELY